MTTEERNIKLKHLITCYKCEASGKACDENCPTQYEAGTIGEVIENLEAISEILEQQPCEDCINRNDKRIIHTDGLEEGIRCAMCTNPMANDRGCDGGCIVNESMYQNVLNVIKKQILEQEPCDDAVSRQAVHDLIAELLSDYLHDEDREKIEELDVKIEDLEPVTPKEKSEYEHDHDAVKAYNDGQSYILDKIRAEIEDIPNNPATKPVGTYDYCVGARNERRIILEIINKYRGE